MLFFNYLFIVKLQLGLKGIVATKTVGPIIELVIVSFEYFRCEKTTLGLDSFSEVLKGFCTFFIDSLEFTFTLYAEIFGYQIAGLFVAVNYDENQTAAFYAASNISVILWIISSAISTVCRTRINLMIGLKKYDNAKNFYYFYITLIALLGVFF